MATLSRLTGCRLAMWMSSTPVNLPRPAKHSRPDVAIAVPARNEAELIGRCLSALDAAAGFDRDRHRQVTVVVLVNNSDDATASVARAYRARMIDVRVDERVLPMGDAHAGGARRAALDACAALLPDDGVLLTTDADSRVTPAWLVANLAELDMGADAVAGVVAFDAATRAALPELDPARALEWRLAQLHARLGTLLDPRPHNPWPTHVWAWGASLALTLAAYRRIGGVPAVALAEDRALAEAIEFHDLRLRRSHAPVVYTSARCVGRAPGGFADLVQSYATADFAPCDAALEPTARLVHRLRLRARLRHADLTEGIEAAVLLADRLGLATGPGPKSFGGLWWGIERSEPRLARSHVDPASLAAELRISTRLVDWLERREARRADSRRSACAA